MELVAILFPQIWLVSCCVYHRLGTVEIGTWKRKGGNGMYMRELHLGQGGMEVGSCEEKGHGGPRFIGARGVKSERERLGGGDSVCMRVEVWWG